MPRTSLMDKYPPLRELVAELYASGADNQTIANAINAAYPDENVHKNTIIAYRRHPAVLAMIRRLIDERHSRVVRQVDSQLEQRLIKTGNKMDTKTLLEIRKTLAGEKHVVDDNRPEDGGRSMTEELFDLADEDPETAERIMAAQESGDKSGE